LSIISEFINDWLEYQISLFPTIEGIFILDDIVGFLDHESFKSFVLPYLKSSFSKGSIQICSRFKQTSKMCGYDFSA
jgi:hypothetical protein